MNTEHLRKIARALEPNVAVHLVKAADEIDRLNAELERLRKIGKGGEG